MTSLFAVRCGRQCVPRLLALNSRRFPTLTDERVLTASEADELRPSSLDSMWVQVVPDSLRLLQVLGTTRSNSFTLCSVRMHLVGRLVLMLKWWKLLRPGARKLLTVLITGVSSLWLCLCTIGHGNRPLLMTLLKNRPCVIEVLGCVAEGEVAAARGVPVAVAPTLGSSLGWIVVLT